MAQLGMGASTARSKLRKLLLFTYAKKLELGNCYRCGKEISSIEDFTVDHKRAWLHVNPALFWDVDNIAFSHSYCNAVNKRSIYDGRTHKKCKNCLKLLPINQFSYRQKRNGYRPECTKCRTQLLNEKFGVNKK